MNEMVRQDCWKIFACFGVNIRNYQLPFVFYFLPFLFFDSTAHAADVRLVVNESSPSVYILIAGDIVEGDYARFIQRSRLALGVLKKSNGSQHEVIVAINSDGGNLAEAIQIGMAIRDMRLATRVGAPFEISQGVTANHCMSACLFILAGGITRDSPSLDFSKIKIGVHRPSFESVYYARLSVREAERKFKILEQVSRKYLVDMGVSESFVRQMFTIPSNEMLFLDAVSFGREFGNPPFYQERIIANCGSRLSDAEEALMAKHTLAAVRGMKSSASQAYVNQLTAKNTNYRDCLKRIRLTDQLDAMQKYLRPPLYRMTRRGWTSRMPDFGDTGTGSTRRKVASRSGR